jgi:hypothetical protein
MATFKKSELNELVGGDVTPVVVIETLLIIVK